ncbi:hypothetical protein DFP72DRAFT_1130352 [Ephemerocybe angulata]|uniref:F-box domain-containing protein n=1 Tax=Ephemerocybe angulata TaxID=980116 RepID=A0A8H6IIK5_9AGAR|nr:hypothetical protein DFP72DRAFT_1130352 [Tulosesus angulatus]
MDTMEVEEFSSAQGPTSPSVGNFRLSSEIIMQILRFLGPKDILSMRKTCRMMHTVTKDRVVWLEALKRICEQYGIFKPTFPMEGMSLLELEHASTGPTRFLNGVKKHEPETWVRPYLTRMPQLRESRSSHDSSYSNAVHLVPGGRFLFTSGRNDICLFDLGYSMNVPVKPFPIATLKDFGELEAVAPTTNGKELLIATIKRPPPGAPASVILYIHQIKPNRQSKDLKFWCKGQMEMNGLQAHSFIGDVHLTSTHTIFRCNQEFILWNWGGNTGCRWPTSNVFLRANYMPFYAFKDTLLACGRHEGICIYDLPTATPLAIRDQARPVQLYDLQSLTNEPKAWFPSPDWEAHTIKHCASSVWCKNSPHDPHVCLLYQNDETSHLRLYSIKPLKGPETFLPHSLPAPGGHTFYGDDHEFSVNQILPTLFRCEDELVICMSTDQLGLMMSILPVPSKATLEEITPTTVALVPAGSLREDIERSQFAFCPRSGRAVYLGSSGASDDVQVVDYLLPPEEPFLEFSHP